MVIKQVDSIDIITKINEKYEILTGVRKGDKKNAKKESGENKANYDLLGRPMPKFNHLIMTM